MVDDFESQIFKTRDASSYDSLTENFDFYTEILTSPLAALMIELAEISTADTVLDVGTGTGIVALQVAQITGNNGTVYGIDLSQEMLAKATDKVRQKSLENKVSFIKMDAEALEFENQKFDVIVSLFALLHFPNPDIALQEMFRVLKPTGKVVIAVGSGIPFSLNGWLHIMKRAPDIFRALQGKQFVAPHFLDNFVNKHIPKTEDLEESSLASHSLNRTKSVRKLIEKAGFKILKTSWRGHQNYIKKPEQFWEIQRTFSSIARKRLSTISKEKFEFLKTQFLTECRLMQENGGELVYPFGAYYVVAKPQISG